MKSIHNSILLAYNAFSLGDSQAAFMGTAQRPLSTEETTQLLKPRRVNLVAQRSADSFVSLAGGGMGWCDTITMAFSM